MVLYVFVVNVCFVPETNKLNPEDQPGSSRHTPEQN